MADPIGVIYLANGKKAVVFGYVTDHHSAYQEIPLNEEVTIGDKKQMNVLGGHFKVSGFLRLEGELRIRE